MTGNTGFVNIYGTNHIAIQTFTNGSASLDHEDIKIKIGGAYFTAIDNYGDIKNYYKNST